MQRETDGDQARRSRATAPGRSTSRTRALHDPPGTRAAHHCSPYRVKSLVTRDGVDRSFRTRRSGRTETRAAFVVQAGRGAICSSWAGFFHAFPTVVTRVATDLLSWVFVDWIRKIVGRGRGGGGVNVVAAPSRMDCLKLVMMVMMIMMMAMMVGNNWTRCKQYLLPTMFCFLSRAVFTFVRF